MKFTKVTPDEVRVHPNSSVWCPHKRKQRHREKEHSHRETEAATGMMPLRAHGRPGIADEPQEPGRKASSLDPSAGAWLCLASDH